MAANRVTVIIDMREAALIASMTPYKDISGSPWTVEVQRLDVGDIEFRTHDLSGVRTALVLERKSAEDLGASLSDGRYREQRSRLLSLRGGGTAIGYILEVPPWSTTLSRTWCRGTFTELQLQTMIARIQLRYGIPVIVGADVASTVMWIRRIVAALVADPRVYAEGLATTATAAASAYHEAIHVKKATNSSPQEVFVTMVRCIPGVGNTAAAAIAASCSHSMQKLLQCSESDLNELLVGKRKLGKLGSVIYNTLHTTITTKTDAIEP